jgi:hypothetical protein
MNLLHRLEASPKQFPHSTGDVCGLGQREQNASEKCWTAPLMLEGVAKHVYIETHRLSAHFFEGLAAVELTEPRSSAPIIEVLTAKPRKIQGMSMIDDNLGNIGQHMTGADPSIAEFSVFVSSIQEALIKTADRANAPASPLPRKYEYK